MEKEMSPKLELAYEPPDDPPPPATPSTAKTIVRQPKTKAQASSNWKQLAPTIKTDYRPKYPPNRKPKDKSKPKLKPAPKKVVPQFSPVIMNAMGFPAYDKNGKLLTPGELPYNLYYYTKIVALDCEMVGVGPMKEDALARVSIVNELGACLYDKFVKPRVEITDYRTAISGITPAHMIGASDLASVTRAVHAILRGHILVGHSVNCDLKVLMINHPRNLTRDTSVYFKRNGRRQALKKLARELLGVEIQNGEHNSIEDAQAAMALYLRNKDNWERSLMAPPAPRPPAIPQRRRVEDFHLAYF